MPLRFWCWDTGDEPTDHNLRFLGQLAESPRDHTADSVSNRFGNVITVEKMLPAVIKAHFQLPFLFIGDSAEHWSATRRAEKIAELTTALTAGLESLEIDPSLKRGGGADFSDRPASKGEEIAGALQAYRDSPGSSELSELRQATYGTSLRRYVEQLDKWLVRKRPSPGGPSIEYEIALALGEIGRRASDWHHEPASYRFRNQK